MLASSPASTRATRSRVFVLATSTMVILAARCNGCSGPTADPRLRSVVFALRAHNEDQAPNGIVCALGSEEHTSELQSLMRISSAVFCLKKNKDRRANETPNDH